MGRLGADSWEILAHRAVWGTLAAWVFVVLARQGAQVAAVLRSPRLLGRLALSALLIGGNWALYVWGVNAGRVLESSLGYYLTPLLNMAAGALIFRERFDALGLGAIVLAGIGVALQGVALGHFPWMAVVLALSFGAYGIVRKLVQADAQTGLFVECLFLPVPGPLWIAYASPPGPGHLAASPAAAAWLPAAGSTPPIPLALFASAARGRPLGATVLPLPPGPHPHVARLGGPPANSVVPEPPARPREGLPSPHPHPPLTHLPHPHRTHNCTRCLSRHHHPPNLHYTTR